VEFKRVEVTVSWVDGLGATQRVNVRDSVSSVPAGSSALATAPPVSGTRNPVVRIVNPDTIPGVIPIAIGDGTDTAATNPRPEVAGQGNSQAVVETRFEVLTYQGISGTNLAEVQARVETIVVGCTCAMGNSTAKGFRPTFWNGSRYTRPVANTTNAPAVHSPGGGNSPPQSQHCVACCRDHHDANSAGPKFSPRRTNHVHTGTYTEACRMIRVDGIVHTAADMSNDYFNLLATADDANSPVPSDAGQTNYENFVLRYLGDRMVSGTAYNTLPSAGVLAGYETQFNMNEPASLQMRAAGDRKWLHSRGLYIDYLEPDAITAINNAKALTGCQGTAAEGCVLRRVPFTSINLTELSNWTPRLGTQIVVTNSDFRDSIASATPVRGRVDSVSATVGTRPVATGSIMNSNAGVALILDPINDETVLTDGQEFQIVGAGSGGGGTAGTFRFSVTGYPWNQISGNAVPSILFTMPTGSGNVCNYGKQGNSHFYDCSTTDISGAISMSARNYNFAGTQSYTLNCTQSGTGTVTPLTCNFPVCRNFAVSSVTNGVVGAVTDDGKRAEATAMSFSSIAAAANLSLVFAEESATRATDSMCTYISGSNNNQRCNSSEVVDPCL